MDQRGWLSFVKLCASAKDAKALELLLELFLTAEEKDSLSTRYLIVKELLAGQKTQREIAKDLSVSIAKITRGSNELKRIAPKLRQHLETALR